MLKHYLRTALRNLWRFRGYTAINIAGLAIGMATCILIFGYISQELSYDKFHDDYENLYRVSVKGRLAEDNLDVAVSMPPLANKIKTDYPEVKAVTRIEKFEDELFFSYNDRNYYEAGLYYADSTFFDVFTFEMIRGNPQKALVAPHSLVITESIAKKYFGDEDPMGKVLRLNDESDMLITGIIRDVPDNTHLKFTMLASFTTLIQEAGKERYDQNWGSMFLHTYVRLNDNIDLPGLKKKLSLVVKEAFGEAAEGMNIEIIPYLQPVTRIHLHSHLLAEIEPNSDISYVYIFASVAVFILFIACINFMNLSTARSSKRSREVAMRKVCGATRGQLVRQFIGESVLLSLAGMLLALILVELARDLTGPIQRGPAIILLLALVLVVGIAAGSYPAFILSSFQPIRIIRKDYYRGFKKSVLRNILVVVQFTISITLLISTWLVYEQLSYIRNKNLGFDQENVVIVPLRGDRLKEKSDILRKEFAALPFVEAVATSSSVPGKMMDGTGYSPEGIDKNSPWIIYNMRVDYDCMDVFGFKLVEGRGFLKESGTDSSAVIINEALVKKLGWDEPVWKKIYQFGQEKEVAYTVIGVIKDYHFKSLHEPVEPSMLLLNTNEVGYLSIRLAKGNIGDYIEKLRQKWDEVEHAFSFDYFFMADDLQKQYRSEQRMGQLFIFFTILAVFIACLGLFGLASYSVEQRTKEIGIRKVLGASAKSLVIKLTKEFTRWVLLANIIAWPLAWWLMDEWLKTFAYRIEITRFFWIFIVSGLVAFVIAIFTVSFQALNAANSDPVDAIKFE